MEFDLASLDGLRAACDYAQECGNALEPYQRWQAEVTAYLAEVADADETERATLGFQERLWDDNPVTSVGQGRISVEDSLADPAFREWFARASTQPLPEQAPARTEHLSTLVEELLERLDRYCKRMPRLKMFRALAAQFPLDFTSVSDVRTIHRIHRALLVKSSHELVASHRRILDRIHEAVGPAGDGYANRAKRMSLPWLLLEHVILPQDTDQTEVADEAQPGTPKLNPMPARRRRKGLTAIRGMFQGLPAILDVINEGVTREELLAQLRKESPDSKDSSLGTTINVLQSEVAVIRREGDAYVLTDRGATVLETGDPESLADWLLTRILGVDHVLLWLREGPYAQKDLLGRLQEVNPGWTTTYAPQAIVSWLRSLGLVETGTDWMLRITPDGEAWAEQIHWVPESLEPPPAVIIQPVGTVIDKSDRPKLTVPPLDPIVAHVQSQGNFDPQLIANLHAGLWLHHRRHFAVLTGLSGSGKTLLAHEYARALTNSDRDRYHILTVQPGWYDPSPLLGYVNPLRNLAYSRTAFVDFLIQASQHPNDPYVVVLDEMNLSRPEQYLAPLLSAMETGAAIDLHREGPVFDGVPDRVLYPSNLFLIGTVNMDETTHGLSDKVLDRAFVLEFWKIDLDDFTGWDRDGLSAEVAGKAKAALSALYGALEPARLHFGWRIVDDVLGFLETSQDHHAALDAAIYAKVLPKLRGDDSPRLREAFQRCDQALDAHGLTNCRTKLAELIQDLETTGAARFWR